MSNTIKDKIIMGIDPGTNIMGFGIIKVVNNNMEILELNELNISKEKPPITIDGFQACKDFKIALKNFTKILKISKIFAVSC